MSHGIERPESRQEGSVVLDALSFEFCGDDLVRDFYGKKLREMEDYTKWLEDSRENLEQNREKIAKAVEDGLLNDPEPETIWKFQADKARESQEKVLAIKKEIESRIKEIRDETGRRLGKFLPDWFPGEARITFTMNEKADFCVEGETVTVDLGRLSFEQNPVEKVKEGLAHEVFHLWMKEKNKRPDPERSDETDDDLKNQIISRTVDEGLAVLVSGQSLAEHHQKQGRDYQEYIAESFEFFREFLAQDDGAELEKINEKEFRNMGHFYVVGNEIAAAVLRQDGMEKFRGQIVEARDNPPVFLGRYRKICGKNAGLHKIDP